MYCSIFVQGNDDDEYDDDKIHQCCSTYSPHSTTEEVGR